MNKRQLIEEIIQANQTAKPSFLAQFSDEDLHAYLQHLRQARMPRMTLFAAGDDHAPSGQPAPAMHGARLVGSAEPEDIQESAQVKTI